MSEEMKRLHEEAQKCVYDAREKMNSWEHEHKGEPIPADLEQEVDKLLAKAEELKGLADAEYSKMERHRRMGTLVADLDQVKNRIPLSDAGGSRNPLLGITGDEEKAIRSAVEVKAFYNYLRGHPVKTGIGPDEVKTLTEAVDTEGGYLAPEEFRATLIRKLADVVHIRSRATVLTTARESVVVPTLETEQDAEWAAEAASMTVTSDEAFGERRLTPHKLSRGTKVTEELLEDSAINLIDLLTTVWRDKFAAAEDSAFVEGTGVGRPTGVKVSTQITDYQPAGTTITADKLIDTTFQIKATYRQRAAWLIRRSNLAKIRKLKTGDQQYLWAVGLQPGSPNTLCGYPVMETEYLDAETSSAIVAMFGDFSYYWIADRREISIKRLDELYAVEGKIGLLATKRTDGDVAIGEAFTRLKMA